jgi:putative transposase
MISIEDLDIIKLINLGGENKYDRGKRRNFRLAALGILTHMLSYKAEEAGRKLIKVDPRNTTQLCSRCGRLIPKDLSVRIHICPYCGLILDRDTNSAKNVLIRGEEIELGNEGFPAPTAERSCEDWSLRDYNLLD